MVESQFVWDAVAANLGCVFIKKSRLAPQHECEGRARKSSGCDCDILGHFVALRYRDDCPAGPPTLTSRLKVGSNGLGMRTAPGGMREW
jgi:hypothetical protein